MSLPTKARTLPSWAGGGGGASLPATHAERKGKRGIGNLKEIPNGPKDHNDDDDENSQLQQQSTGDTGRSGRPSPMDADTVSETAAAPATAASPASRETEASFLKFSRLLEGVVFSISGLVNPERTELRNMALAMGAEFRPKWSDDSTLLVCPFANTPTFRDVKAVGGTVVQKDWIEKCYSQRALVPIELYLLHAGKPWRAGSHGHDSSPGDLANDFPIAGSPRLVKAKDQKVGSKSSQTFSPKKEPGNHDGDGNVNGAGKLSQDWGDMKNHLASPVEVQQWVLKDFAATLTWLEQQSDKPQECELETVAAQGLLVCLEDAIKSLQENKGLNMVMDNWAFVPKAVKELAAYERGGRCVKDQLVAEGERFRLIYESQLQKLGFGFAPPPAHQQRSSDSEPRKRRAPPSRHGHDLIGETERRGNAENLHHTAAAAADDDDGDDDDATEIISDSASDSRDPADFDSDNETVELDKDDIDRYKEAILRTF